MGQYVACRNDHWAFCVPEHILRSSSDFEYFQVSAVHWNQNWPDDIEEQIGHVHCRTLGSNIFPAFHMWSCLRD